MDAPFLGAIRYSPEIRRRMMVGESLEPKMKAPAPSPASNSLLLKIPKVSNMTDRAVSSYKPSKSFSGA